LIGTRWGDRYQEEAGSMTLYNTETQSSAEEIFQKAHEIFGADGLGLEIKDQGEHRISFKGDEGEILITVTDEIDPTSVTVETVKYAYPVNEFLEAVGTSD
jgi:hypothetical protein